MKKQPHLEREVCAHEVEQSQSFEPLLKPELRAAYMRDVRLRTEAILRYR